MPPGGALLKPLSSEDRKSVKDAAMTGKAKKDALVSGEGERDKASSSKSSESSSETSTDSESSGESSTSEETADETEEADELEEVADVTSGIGSCQENQKDCQRVADDLKNECIDMKQPRESCERVYKEDLQYCAEEYNACVSSI